MYKFVDRVCRMADRVHFHVTYYTPSSSVPPMLYNTTMTQKLAGGVAHTLPKDLQKALAADAVASKQWQSLTPLARNEWICWTIDVKQQKTRDEHVARAVSELKEGKRRPCCWIGCVHRKDKEISPSIKWVLSRRAK